MKTRNTLLFVPKLRRLLFPKSMLIRLVDKTRFFALYVILRRSHYWLMKSIKMKNEEGETFEIKREPDGSIKICHSDMDATAFGDFVDLEHVWELATMRIPGLQQYRPAVKKYGFDAIMMLQGKSYILGADEISSIREAIPKLQ